MKTQNNDEKKILVFDEFDRVKELVYNKIFSNCPHINVIVENDERDVINLTINHDPDLIIMDLDFKNNDTEEGLKIIFDLKRNEETKDIPIVIFAKISDVRYAELIDDRPPDIENIYRKNIKPWPSCRELSSYAKK